MGLYFFYYRDFYISLYEKGGMDCGKENFKGAYQMGYNNPDNRCDNMDNIQSISLYQK